VRWKTVLRARAWLWVAIPGLWALAYLPNLGVRPLRLEEGRRAAPARAMLDSGNYTVPILYGRPYVNKPPGFFWTVAGVGALRGDVDAWAARLPSALAALSGAVLVGTFARSALSPLTRYLAALLFLSGFMMLDKGTLGEIDALFSMLVFAALAAWWAGTGPGRLAQWGWVAAGILLGLATLTKGPAGLVLFYVPVLAFLAWEGDWRRLRHPAHALGLALAILPGLLWAWRLAAHLDGGQVLDVWVRELGRASTARESFTYRYLLHLVQFPLDLTLMLLPWGPVAAVAVLRALRETQGPGGRVGRWLACVVLAPSVFFWLYPETRPRYVLVVCYGVSLLAAMVATAPVASRPGRHAEGAVRVVERLGPALPLALGIAGLVVALVVTPGLWGAALVGLLVGAATAGSLSLLTRRPAMADRAAAALASLAVVILVGWFQVTLLFNPWQAERDPPRVAWHRVSAHVPPGQPQYARVRYYNVLFYFARDLELLGPREYGRLPRGVPVTLFVTRAEFDRLREHPAFRVRELAHNPARAHKPTRTLVVAEVVRDGDAQDFVGDGEPHEFGDEPPDTGARRGLIRDS
jgi:4-amino-4-deoxy-L-arabinose transferase-like glycosyltransferase